MGIVVGVGEGVIVGSMVGKGLAISIFGLNVKETPKRKKQIMKTVSRILLPVVIWLIVLYFPKTTFALDEYWLVLDRRINIEQLYIGNPGVKEQSILLRTFRVKTGIPGKRPTPLPQLVGKDFWQITKKYASHENPETAPYFLELNIPGGYQPPYGPVPYTECNGQCNWELPGAFGLHGINGDFNRLSETNPGSSGCIRHTDKDITYLYSVIPLNTAYFVH